MGKIKPIIVLGTGRSGTTIFLQMISRHPNLAWLSQLANRYPYRPALNKALMSALDYPLVSTLLRKRINAAESYKFWEFHCKGFSLTCRDLLASDVSNKNKKQVQNAIAQITTEKRNRPLLKITGWPRLGFFSEIFEDAKFIHVVRDGRAVANSLINVGFWRGWGGPEKWLWGPLSFEHQQEWESYNRSFVVLAAIQWKILMTAAEEAKMKAGGINYLEIKYEQLCLNPIAEMRKVMDFAELGWSRKFENELNQYNLKNTNDKWKRDLNFNQQQALNEVLREFLIKYDYLDAHM